MRGFSVLERYFSDDGDNDDKDDDGFNSFIITDC